MAGHPCVVAGVDFSEISPFVVRTALRAAGRLGRPLRIVHAAEDLGAEGEGPVLPALRERIEETWRETRASMAGLIGGLGLPEGAAPACDVLSEERWRHLTGRGGGLELLVVGAPHPGPALGSFAAPLLRRCVCPVLVARRPVEGYRKILVGVDFSTRAAGAWDLALRLAEPHARVVACLAGVPETDAANAARLAEWVGSRSGDFNVQTILSPGRARDVLVRGAREEGFDLVAVGRSGHGALHDMLLGSTARTVAHEAPCDVVVAGTGAPATA